MVCVRRASPRASQHTGHLEFSHTGVGASPVALPLEEFGSFFLLLSYEDAHSDMQGRTG